MKWLILMLLIVACTVESPEEKPDFESPIIKLPKVGAVAGDSMFQATKILETKTSVNSEQKAVELFKTYEQTIYDELEAINIDANGYGSKIGIRTISKCNGEYCIPITDHETNYELWIYNNEVERVLSMVTCNNPEEIPKTPAVEPGTNEYGCSSGIKERIYEDKYTVIKLFIEGNGNIHYTERDNVIE